MLLLLSNKMGKIIKFILIKISRVIFWITPREFRPPLRRNLLEIKLEENLQKQTFDHFKEHFKCSILFNDSWKVREYAIKTSLLNDKNKEFYYLEFGVFKGQTANFFSQYVEKLYVFDSFEGLKEDWIGTSLPKGHYDLKKEIPRLNSNIEPTVGWVEDTLDDFLKKHSPKINFVHLDLDTFNPTKFTLKKIKPYLVKDAIILFDELYNFLGWEEGEYKALNEVFGKNEYRFKSFNIKGATSCIQIK